MGEPQNEGNNKTKHVKVSEKTDISYPHDSLPTGGKKCLFFGKFDVVCFIATSILGFALLP